MKWCDWSCRKWSARSMKMIARQLNVNIKKLHSRLLLAIVRGTAQLIGHLSDTSEIVIIHTDLLTLFQHVILRCHKCSNMWFWGGTNALPYGIDIFEVIYSWLSVPPPPASKKLYRSYHFSWKQFDCSRGMCCFYLFEWSFFCEKIICYICISMRVVANTLTIIIYCSW
jgi:hypothetical protein